MERRIVVTGGAGFIGSNIAGKLVDDGQSVIVIDDLSTGRFENIAPLVEEGAIEFVQGSILDIQLLNRVMNGADFVLHQAALPSVQRSIENPLSTNAANLTGTLNVLVTARDCGVKKVVMASSSSVYGDTPTLPKVEDMKPNPKSPYAVSKIVGEYYARTFSEIYGLGTACLRYFNVYGPHQNPNSDYAAVIPRFITSILEDRPPVINGDGSQTRDFTFVRDVVKANLLAMESPAQGAFNIACGRRISINQLAERIMDITGNRPAPIYREGRKGDVKDSLADISRAKNELGFEPDYYLERGLEATVGWYVEQTKPAEGERPRVVVAAGK